MKKYIIISALLIGLMGNMSAQKFGPSAGDMSGSVLFGTGSYMSVQVPSAPGNYYSSWTVSGQAPYLYFMDNSYNELTNMLGVEIRYFLTGNIAIKASGGAVVRKNPSVGNVPGFADPNSPNATWIPNYSSIEGRKYTDANFNIGADWVFSTKYEKVFPYAGLNVPFVYGRRTFYDPTVTFPESGDPVIVDISERHGEAFAFGLQAVGGIDYYFAEAFYMGFECKPLSWIHAGAKQFPAAGLEPLESKSNTVSYFSQISFKLGFKFR
ncbi:MAG: BT1926 family outer membrane beta-barrel protein [Methanosarcina sp.]